MTEELFKANWSDIGRGSVVGSKAHPAWYVNSALNNPSATATGAAAVTGAGAQLPKLDRKRSAKKEKAVDVASGAALGAGAGLAADRGAFYALKREYLKPENRSGQNGRAAKREIKRVKAEAAEKHPGNPRKQEHYKNANWPEGFKDTKLRHLSATRTGGKNAAALAAAGGAIGVGVALTRNKKEKVKKMMDHSDSPFLVGYDEVSKAKAKKEKSNPSGARYASAVGANMLAPGLHGAVAGRKGHKLKAWGTETGAQVGGAVGGLALGGPALGNLGGFAGSAGGAHIAHKRGWLKPEKK